MPSMLQAEVVVAGKAAETVHRHGHRDAGLLREGFQLRGRVAGDDAAAGVNDRPLALAEHLDDLVKLLRRRDWRSGL